MLTINVIDHNNVTVARQFAKPLTILQLASTFDPELADHTLAGIVDGQLLDANYKITKDTEVKIITPKDPAGLEILRHSCAHLLAQAIKQLYPTAKIAIGPVIEHGFYYDLDYPNSLTQADLTKLEEKMHELAGKNFLVERLIMSRDQAIELFKTLGEDYKVAIIEDIDPTQQLSCYKQGDFIDLCRGPHVPNTGQIKFFKLMNVAGAYWRGNANNQMLQRIYGTCWATEEELTNYLYKLAEAEKRDHRKLAKKYDLFHIQDLAPGMIFWHPKGWTIFQLIKNYISEQIKHDYQEVCTPQLLDRSLWERSGHWDKFKQNMFTIETEEYNYAIKPMSCPGHVQIFNQGIKSYRDLPFRLAEFGCCHRCEPSGALHGAMRTRSFTQDDGHIFCTEDQIASEADRFIESLFAIYKDFGFDKIEIKLSTRPTERVGSDEIWDKAELALRSVLEHKKLVYQENKGEGAFYGPKIEFSLLDCLDRVWQCGTLQIDFSMPARLGVEYVDHLGNRNCPVMLHRAVLGSIERFIAILLETTAGNLPTWLAPVQVVVASITDQQQDQVIKITKKLLDLGYRVKEDLRNEKIGFKIREHAIQKVPFLLIIGNKEVAANLVAVRTADGNDLGSMQLHEFIDLFEKSINLLGRKNY